MTYLEMEKRQRRAVSASAVLDEILLERKRDNERRRIDASMRAYYDSLTDSQMAEDEKWGEFSESQFPAEQDS